MSLEKKTFRIAVSDLVQNNYKEGSLSNTYTSRQRALAGIKEHIRVQNLRPDNYKKEEFSEMMDDARASGDFGSIREVMREKYDERNKKIKELLNEDQIKEFDKMLEERRKEMEERRRNRGF